MVEAAQAADPAAGGVRAAVVTGSSRGLGAVIARELAADGWAVAVNYRSDPDGARRVVQQISEAGGRAVAVQADITNQAGVAHLVEAASELGPVLAVVANATGPQPVTAIEDLTWQTYLDQLEFFVRSPTLLVQEALPTMKEHRHGRVIMIGSDMVDRAKPGWSAYAAAKAGEAALTKIWSRELGPHQITVNLVAPGWIPVERHEGADTSAYAAEVPLGRTGTPEEVASLVVYLASDAAGFVTGQRISVNGAHVLS